jgi:hypothetical protein
MELARDKSTTIPDRARARKPCCAASRLPSFQSQTRTGTVAGRFPAPCGQSQLRFAGSGPHSPPRWRTRGRRSDLSLPLQEKSDSGDLSGQVIASGLGNQHRQLQPDRPAPTPPPSRHTDKGVLAQPFNNSKKSGWGQMSLPRPHGIRSDLQPLAASAGDSGR